LDLESESKTLAQYQRNITRHQELADATYSVVKSLKRISDRAGEIATLSDGLKSPLELNAYATEVTQMIKQAVDLMNTKNRGDHLFSGTMTDQAAFALQTDADGLATGVTYGGNGSVPESEIAAGVTVSAQVAGANTSGTGPRGLITETRHGADLFEHLISLQNHLLAGDTEAIATTDSENLRKDEDNLLFHITSNGVMQARLETSEAMAGDRALSLETQISSEVDADLAETLIKLTQTQTAYQAALQSGASVLRLSLLDYLR